MSFKLHVWNVLEDTHNVDHFAWTKKGIIREVTEYARALQKEFRRQTKISDKHEFIRKYINRDIPDSG